jgi:ankyrin repeat protein
MNLFKKTALNQNTDRMPDFNVKDANGQTVLSYCLWNGMLNLAKKLIGKFEIHSFQNKFLNFV